MDSYKILLLAFLVATSQAGPVYKLRESEENHCALTCSDNNKFNYEPGNIYEFTYNAETTTKMNGASEDSAFMVIDADFDIEPVTKCDFVMRINDATLRDSGDALQTQTFKEALMKQPVKFSFQDGRIDHICAMNGEPTWTLNIKRGILSAFQNSMDSFDRSQNLTETDVVGTCLSEYKVTEKDPRTKLVEKTKSLLGCSDREGYRLAIQSIGYDVASFVKSLPLMKSEYKCTQTLDLDSNILQRSTCSEEHVFRPFSYGKNGAMTISEQTLTFSTRRTSERTTDEHFSQRSTLLFQHQHDIPSKQVSEKNIEAKLQELCQKATEDIRPEVPEMVNQLIEHMRPVDQDVLLRVYKKINQKTFCADKTDRIKQYFHDAIPMVGTTASVRIIQDLISKKHVTGGEAEMWMLSLSFVHNPTKEMVAAATPLLEEHDPSGNTLLAVSSLASSYCNVRPECGKDSEMSSLIRKLIGLTHDCNTQNGDSRTIVFALRALGNIGHSHLAVSHLTRCSTRRDVPEEIRIAAMDAFRRVPCDATRSDLMGVFRDESEDSEIRLNAYIALMKCPSKNVLSEVREVLEKEKSNQVGSFVWTHLTNLMETSDPHMQDIRNIVQDEELKKEFNLDQRKFSRNYEGSFFLDSINAGAKVDSNVIFSEKSFIPRSANLNLTIDLFGHAINFLEFGGRVQGMERVLENFFGPAGTKMPTLKTKVPINFDKSMDDFRGSAFLRVFGNELRYWDDKSLNELQSSLRQLMNMQSLSFSKSMQLIDSRMIIPTCVGLPLNLTMSATGSISVDGKASLQQSQLNVNFKPSASVQVKGEMSVDAHVSRAGLKMVTVAHTSTGAMLNIRNNKFDLQIPQKKMEIFNLKTDFYIVHRNAEKKQKMIVDNVQKHEICTGNMMKQVTGLTFCQNIKFPNASSHNEAPFFPFTGPVVYDLYMMNEDAPNGYQIEGFTKQSPYSFYMDTPNSKVPRRIVVDTVIKNKNEVQFTFQAPWKNIKIEGTIINRDEIKKITGKLSFNGRTDYTLNAELGMDITKRLFNIKTEFEVTTPQNKMTYEGQIVVRPMETLMINMHVTGFVANEIYLKVSGEFAPKGMIFTTKLEIGKKQYYIAGQLGKLVSKTGFKYTPSLKITIPSKDLVEFTSEIFYEPNKKMSFDFELNKVLPKTIAMNALILLNAGKTKTKHILRVLFKSPRGNFRIICDVDNKKAARVIVSYNFGAKYSDRLTLSTKIRDLSVKKSVRYMGNVALASKKQQFLNFNLKGQLAKAINHLETKFDFHYGNPKIKTNLVKFACVLNRALKPLSHVYDYTMAIQHPGQKIDYKVEANHVQSAKWPFKKFENTVMVQMAPGKVVQTKLAFNNAKEKGLPKYESEISLSYPGRDMKIADKLVQLNKNTYENYFTVQWQKGLQTTVQSTYTKIGKDIHNIENILTLANKKEAKVTARLQVTQGAYKTRVQFTAGKDVISRQQISCKFEGGVTYIFSAKQISTDINGEVIWAPNQKISTNINFDYMKKSSLSGKVAFSTPFDAMKNFDSEAKFTWANGKYASMMTASWNDRNELKQDLSFVYSDFHLSYDASALLNNKKSEVGITMKYSDMSLNGNIKVNHDRTTIINVILKHNAHRMGFVNEIGLDFDILDSNGKMKITLKYDKRKGELMSNGEGKLNLPLQQLRQIGGSYNLKHNNDLSSIDMGYSSSSRNYKNGKMSVEMKRNLPMMHMTKVEITLNDKPFFNINANYGNEKDNIDMKIDITEPNGQKITVSGNINLSGSRKTGNVELKSRYINLSAGGAFEYQGTRSASGELKMTIESTLNGHEKYEMSASYKHLSELQIKTSIPSYQNELLITLSGNLKAFNAQTKFSHNNQMYELILSNKDYYRQIKGNLNTPYFQDTASFKFDGEFSAMNIFAQVMHNEDKFELTFSNKGYYQQIDAKLDTPFLKPTLKFALNGNPKRFNVELKIQFDNEIYEMKASNEAYFRQMNFLLDTPFLNCNFQFEGDLDNAKGSLTVSYGNAEYELTVSNKNFFQDCSLTVTIPKHVLKVNGKMNIKKKATIGNFNIIYNKKKLSLSGSYKDLGRKKIVKADLNTPYFKDSLTAVLNGKPKEFNAQLKIIHNGETYEVTASNKNFHEMIDLNIYAPGMEAKFDFEGELKRFESFASVKIMNDMYRLGLSNDNYFRNINMEVTTPQTGNIMLSYNLRGDLNNFNLTSQLSYSKNKYELNVFGDSRTREHWFTFVSPQINVNGHFHSDLEGFTSDSTAVFNKQKYAVMASTKNYFRDISGKLTTPQFGEQSLSVKVNGQIRDLSAFIIVDNNNEIYRGEFSLKNREFSLSLPKWLKMLEVEMNDKVINFVFDVELVNSNGERIQISASNKNFQEIKAHIAIPKLKDIDVSVKSTGNLRKGGATINISYGKNIFENDVKFSFDGRQASFEIEPHYMILGRSGKAKLQMDLMFEAQSYKYEFEAEVEGTQVKSMASVKISPEISVLMTVNIPTLDASEMKLRIVSRGFQKTDIMLNLKSPWTGMTNIFYEHNGQMGKMFSTKGYIERDGVRLTGYSLDTDFSGDYSFDFKCDYDNSKNNIETKGDLRFQGVKTKATLSINTPFQVFKEVFVVAQTKMLRDGPSVELNVKLPNQQYSLNFDLSNTNFNAILNLNMDKKNKDKQYQLQTTYRNTDRRADVSRSFNFKMIFPQRTVLMDSRFENSRRSTVMAGDLMWGETGDQKAGFELMIQKDKQKEGKLRIITPRRTIELFATVEVKGDQYTTVGHLLMDENNQAQKVDISADMMILSDRADIDLTVKFPNQKQGMNLKTSINLPKGDLIFSSTSEFNMDQDPKKSFKMSTKLMSVTKGKRQMYTVQMDAGHTHSGFATHVIGRVSSTPEKYNADVEIGYLTITREQKKFAIHGEMHRLNREINLKLKVPSKTIELDGSLRNGNRYTVSLMKKESGKENMEALFKLNPKSQKMSMIINYDEANPNKLYRIDADIMKSKTTFKAYRANKQRKQSVDGRITVELKTNNIFQSYIKWNPDFLEELNVYGYQKLRMYRNELESFRDSLSQVVNDEVPMKFAIVKRSFSEDMVPVIDYFTTEYRSLSEDFARAKRHMEQMFEHDSFYMRSATEAIGNVWDKMNFDEYLTRMKQEIEIFNGNMNSRMIEAKKQFDYYYGPYSVQLKNKINELFDNYQEHYEMLYERVMKMKAEIVSFIRDYPETIKELINRMRQNAVGEQVVIFLTEMYEAFNEKTVQVKEHMNTLTSSIYSAHATLNRHIANARRYPIVDEIMKPLDKVYQQALWSYNYWDIKDNVFGLRNTLYKFGAKKIKEIKNIITDIGMNTLVFDPKRGEIIVEIRFGAAKYFYDHFMSGVEDIERAVMKLKNLMPNFSMNVWDIYYMMKPSSDLEDYIPPFKAEATLFADQHFTTFDGRHFDYNGGCSSLLTRDFVDGNFTIVANRDAETKTLKSLTVTTAHNEQVEIFSADKVLFNGRDVRLVHLTDAMVIRHDNLILMESKRGYKVMFDKALRLYTVQISGWYFNKVAGLFGNFNNEVYDDNLTSEGSIANDWGKLAETWTVSRQCKDHRNLVRYPHDHMIPENRECANFFLQTDSQFRYCFRQVNPDKFYKTCAVQMSSSEVRANDLCDITSFYRMKCQSKGVYLSMPAMCYEKTSRTISTRNPKDSKTRIL